jgi:DNA-binding transcriptional regulator YiaG
MNKKLNVVNVGAIRAEHGLSIKEFADLLDVPMLTYTQWEYGGGQPSGAAALLLQIMAARPDVVHEVLGPLALKKRAFKRKKHENAQSGKTDF